MFRKWNSKRVRYEPREKFTFSKRTKIYRKHTCTSATSDVLGEDDLQSIFKYFTMATGSVIRGKQAKLLAALGIEMIQIKGTLDCCQGDEQAVGLKSNLNTP